MSIQQLESGNLLFYPDLAFPLLPEELLLLSPSWLAPRIKNISWQGTTHALRGTTATGETQIQLQNLLIRFSHYAQTLIQNELPHYISALEIGRTSFRPAEAQGRASSYRKDDMRLHVDAFPATPNQGRRILRVFSNINPDGKDRVWRIGESFEAVAKRFVPQIPKPIPGSAWLLEKLGITKGRRTPYDHFMLHIHDRMKADLNYQASVSQAVIRFPPGSTWIVFSDCTSHAAMAGQHMLEQTFYLPVDAMVDPERSPLKIIEKYLNNRRVD
jgi:hypothetical protein